MPKRGLNQIIKMGWMKRYIGCLLICVLFLAIHIGPSSAIVSDDFNAVALNTSIWTPFNPLGDATFTMTGIGTLNASLNIKVPGGTSHDAWITNNASRVMQTVDNTDFQIEVKFLSVMTSTYQTQGIIIEQDSNNYIRFDFIGTSTNETYIHAANFQDGAPPTQRVLSPIASGNPLYLRINRTGDHWKQFYSYDGNNWILATKFRHELTVNSVGPFAGNVGNPAPSFTAKIDYFFNSSSPVVPEDELPTNPPSIDIWYGNPQSFGQLGVPQQWVNIPGNVVDKHGIASLNYSLNMGSPQPLTIGPDGMRLQSNGDFNIELDRTDLSCGNNTVEIKAVDNAGNMNIESIIVQYSCNNVWPKTYSINWSDVANIQDAVQVVDGRWTKGTDNINTAITGHSRVVAIGDVTWDDYEITAPITLNSPLDPSISNGNFFGFGMRWKGNYDVDGKQPRNGWFPLGAIGGYSFVGSNDYRLQIQGNNGLVIADDAGGMQLTVGVPYIFKMRAQTAGANTVYSLKVWEQDTIEPDTWTISGPGVQGELKTGSILLMSHNADVSIGNVTIKPGPFSDIDISPYYSFSDDFNTPNLNTSRWTLINPKGDATITIIGNGTSDAMLSIAVPRGQDHNPWTTNTAAGLMQPIENKDFEIELKFQSLTTLPYQEQGLIIQQDSSNYIRFDFYSNSETSATTNIFAASFASGNPSVQYNLVIPQSNPMYMKVNRTGDSWQQFYSDDGKNWKAAADFDYEMNVSSIGPFAGNLAGDTSPAFTSLVDYFFDTSFPIVPEDVLPLTQNAQNVLDYIKSIEGNHILSGQFGYLGSTARDGTLLDAKIASVTGGKMSAIREYGAYGETDAEKFYQWEAHDDVVDAKIVNDWNSYSRIPAFSWHMGAPPLKDSYPNTLVPVSCTNVLTPGTVENTAFLKKLDHMGARLQALKDQGVPVLWRPFHEMQSDFWWSCGHDPAQAKALFVYMHDYYTIGKWNLNNLIWIWAAYTGGGYDIAPQYPGDQYVDFVGSDIYDSTNNYPFLTERYDILKGIASSKPAALTENDFIPDPSELDRKNINFVWFLTWQDGDVPYDIFSKNSNSWLNYVYNHPYVINARTSGTKNELPNLKIAISSTHTPILG